jgi:hypothetical protein
VGRGQAIAALYGPLALVWLYLFTLEAPGAQFVVGGLIAVIGSFVLFTEKRDVLEVVRAVPGVHVPEAPIPAEVPAMHMKCHMLQLIDEQGPMWDYDIAEEVMRAYGVSGDYWFGTVRLTLTDLFSSGLLDEVETAVDPDKSHGEEKLLFKFGLNDFGRSRMRQSGLMGASA